MGDPQNESTEREVTRLRDLSPKQWKSGIAAWLGWLFDGLDMHLYVLVAMPFVAQLLATDLKDPDVKLTSSWIQAAFLFGWAFGGGVFGRIADRVGRSRSLMLTILTYALFTGLSFFAQTWWQLLIFRFLAALGIGGEWAIGASLLSETWPKRWRPWMAAVLQSAVNIGVMLACLAFLALADYPPRYIFLVGIVPALLVLWIRRAVPEPEEWQGAKQKAGHAQPKFIDLFRGNVRRTTVLTLLVCGLSLTANWVFMFWYLQHMRTLPELADWSDADRNARIGTAMWFVMAMAIVGNFFAAALARWLGYRPAILILFGIYFAAMTLTYGTQVGPDALWFGLAGVGIGQGAFGLFTMYLPPLFPTLLRTTGAGFCYNIGRIAAGLGTVIFGMFFTVADSRLAIFWSAFMFIPAAAIAYFLPEPPDEQRPASA